MKSETPIVESRGTVVIPLRRQWRERAMLAAVNLAQRFQSDILFCAGTLCIDAKSSLMALMMLGASKGQLVELTARGADAERAVQGLSALFQLGGGSSHEVA